MIVLYLYYDNSDKPICGTGRPSRYTWNANTGQDKIILPRRSDD